MSMRPHSFEKSNRRRTILATTIGNALEYYDFTVYGFLTLVIGKLFFSAFDPASQVLLTIATFGVGFVMRPLGGIVIGAYADRAGRRKAMVLTIFLMALGCAMIAISPTYAQVGIAAPIVIVIARSLQGFSAGGEFGASTALLVERTAPAERGFMASWQFASQGLGVLIAALIVAGLSFALPATAMESYGWRIPFILGLLIAPIGAYLRQHVEEPSMAAGIVSASERQPTIRGGLADLWRDHRRAVIVAIVITMGGTGASYVIGFYMPTYASRELGMSSVAALFGACVTGGLTFVLSPLIGRWSDRIGRKPLIAGGRMALILLIYPAFAWLKASPTPLTLFTVVSLLTAVLAVQAVPSIVILPELFPKRVRASGMSLVYSIGVAVFGGFAPFVSAWLVQTSGDKLAPTWYLISVALLSLFALPYLKDRTGDDIDLSGDAVSSSSSKAKVIA